MRFQSEITLKPLRSISIGLIVLSFGVVQAATRQDLNVTVNGFQLLWFFAGQPRMTSVGRAVIPARAFADLIATPNLGAKEPVAFKYVDSGLCFDLRVGGTKANFCYGNSQVTVQTAGELRKISLETRPFKLPGSSEPAVGISDLARVFGFKLRWDSSSRTIIINDSRFLEQQRIAFDRFRSPNTTIGSESLAMHAYQQKMSFDPKSQSWVWEATLDLRSRMRSTELEAAVLLSSFRGGGLSFNAPRWTYTPVVGSSVPPEPCSTERNNLIRCRYKSDQLSQKDDLRFVMVQFVTGH